MRSSPANRLSFIFQLEDILRSNSNFLTSYVRLTDLKSFLGLLSVSFIRLGEKFSLKYLLIGGEGRGRLSLHVQTVSTLLMSKLVNDKI